MNMGIIIVSSDVACFNMLTFLKSLSVKISMIHVIMENLQSLDMPTDNEF